MNLEILIFPYWLLFAALILGAIYIYKMKVIPTLKKFGRDYETYWSYSKKKKQLQEYKDVCKEQRLTDKYWRYLKWYNQVGFVWFIGWIVLMFLTTK